MILTISNLYPRPDHPHRGMFNAQLFRAFAERIPVRNICLVPEWRAWRWVRIRQWQDPSGSPFATSYLPIFHPPLVGRDWVWRCYARRLRGLVPLAKECTSVYSTWLYPDAVAATDLAEALGRPSWVMVQGSDVFHLHAPDRRRVILECCRKVRGIVCVSRQLADTLINAGVEPGKVHVVPNGVDTDLFRYRAQEEAKRKLSAIGGQPWAREDRKPATGDSGRPQKRVLYVGNLVTVKGLDVLLNAWRLLQTAADRQTASVVLQIVGSGPLRGKLERRARALGIADSVHFVGPRPHPEIPLWMNAADCLCLSSRSEGMPNVVLEALVSGLPLVVSDVGNCRELLNGEPMARVVPAGDAEAMAQGLREVLTFTGARSEMAERHRNRLSWRHQAGVILGLIRAETANTAG